MITNSWLENLKMVSYCTGANFTHQKKNKVHISMFLHLIFNVHPKKLLTLVLVAQLVEVLRYNPEGNGFYSRWGQCDCSLTYIFRQHNSPEFDSAFNWEEYQTYLLGGKSGRCVGLTTLPLLYVDCLKILETSICWSLMGLSRRVVG
jgi:hypothetical protein